MNFVVIEETKLQDLINKINQIEQIVQKLKPDEEKKYYTTEEFAKLAKISKSSLYRKIEDKTIQTKKVGRKILIPATEINF